MVSLSTPVKLSLLAPQPNQRKHLAGAVMPMSAIALTFVDSRFILHLTPTSNILRLLPFR
jgi:hypothetical protein